METVVEPLEGNKVKVSVTVDEQEFEVALDATFKKMGQEVRVPGFRPGKVPRQILEARLGKGVARQEAIRSALGAYYAEAIRENDVDVIAAPEIDITSGEDNGPVVFDAVVEVRPQVKLAGYGGLRVTIPSPVLTDEDVEAQIDRLRSSFGELVAVDRPARDGDNLTLDLKANRENDPDAGTSTDDYVYELGSGTVVPELDDQLQGAVAGDKIGFTAQLPDGEATFEVVVKDVKKKVLPEVTDEWASEASEFDTVDELRADIVHRLTVTKRAHAQVALRTQVIEAAGELVSEEPPTPLVNEEITHRARELESALKQQGMNLGQYLTATGRSQQNLIDELRTQAIHAVKADLALRAVADAENLEVTDTDVEAEIGRLAERFDAEPAQVREQLESSDQMLAVRSDVRKGKAVEWLVERVEAVDEQGQRIDRELLDEAPETDSTDEAATAVETEEAGTGEP